LKEDDNVGYDPSETILSGDAAEGINDTEARHEQNERIAAVSPQTPHQDRKCKHRRPYLGRDALVENHVPQVELGGLGNE
jgi:hypothetical protein